MHATHQFFLSRRSLYVLVLDCRKDQNIEDWLKLIETFGGYSPILVVINKIDENPAFDVNRPFLSTKYKGIKSFHFTSCARNSGIGSFAKALIKELANVELIRTEWAQSWFSVKRKLEDMDEHFIGYEQYKAICLEEGISDQPSQDTLVVFLNDLGIILHFKEFELEDTHVLDPKWVTGAVYKIINSKKLAASKGVLRLSDLRDILKPIDKGDYYYPRDKYKYIIGLMKKFELCYGMDAETVLVPDLLEVREPQFDFNYDSSLRFIIEYDFLPKSVIPRFIVKMNRDIKPGLVWRTGVVLEDREFESIAAIRADIDTKKIYIYVSGTQRKDYFATILYFFREINSSFERLKVIELVPMPDEPEVTSSYKHLVTLASKKIREFIPDGSESVYSVTDLLGIIQLGPEEEILEILRRIENNILDETSFIREANKIIDLKPNFFGLGINLNQLAKKFLKLKSGRLQKGRTDAL